MRCAGQSLMSRGHGHHCLAQCARWHSCHHQCQGHGGKPQGGDKGPSSTQWETRDTTVQDHCISFCDIWVCNEIPTNDEINSDLDYFPLELGKYCQGNSISFFKHVFMKVFRLLVFISPQTTRREELQFRHQASEAGFTKPS